jgi:hypothetical protein
MERLNDGLFISTSSNLVVCLAFFLGFEDVNIYSINPDFLNLFHVFNQLDLFQRNEAFICIVNIILNRETQLIQEATPPIIYIVISSLIQVGFVDEEVIENLLTTYLNEHPEVSRDDVSIVTAMNILKCSKLKMPYKRSNDISNDKKREREDDRDDQDDAKGDDGQAGGNQEKSEDSHQMKKSTNSGGSAGSSNANREDVSKRAENKDFSEDNAKNNDISDVYFVPVEFASSIIANYAPQIVEYSIWAALNIDVVSQLVSYSPAAFEMSVDELSVCGSSLFSNMIDFSQAILG